jgi:predicted RNase H-like HicB family nuclease
MEKVIVTVELADNNYAAYIEKLPGCVSTGKTFDELKDNIEEAITFHLEGMREDSDKIPSEFLDKYELVYHFDTQSLLQHYSGIFTNAALQRLTGINQRQIQRYTSGVSKPKELQTKKIESALHNLGRELLAVEL